MFISRIQQKMVRARGATMGFLPLKEPRTFSSTKSTTHSTKFCAAPGTPEVTLSATFLKNQANSPPSSREKNMVSTLMAQKPICGGLGAVVGKAPAVPRQVTEGQIGQMVLDVLLGSEGRGRGHRVYLTWSVAPVVCAADCARSGRR